MLVQTVARLQGFENRSRSRALASSKGDSDTMKELKIRLKHHLPIDVQESGKEFQEVFDALALRKKISLGDYRFLNEALFDIHTEAVMVIEKYQTKIKEILDMNRDEIESDLTIDVSDIVEKHTL